MTTKNDPKNVNEKKGYNKSKYAANKKKINWIGSTWIGLDLIFRVNFNLTQIEKNLFVQDWTGFAVLL